MVIDDFLTRSLTRWVSWVDAHALAVIAVVLLATVGLGAFAALNLGVNTDNVRMVSPDLPARQSHEAYAASFPNLENALLVVVDGETPEVTRQAADELWKVMREQKDRYHDVYLPGGGEFFERNGLLYRSLDELDEFSLQMTKLQPILATLARDPSMATMVELVELGLAQGEAAGAGTDWSAALDRVSEATTSLYREYPLAVSWESMLLEGSAVDIVKRRVIVVHPVLDFTSMLAAGRAIDTIHATARELGLTPERGVTVRITGNPALNYEELLGLAFDILYAGVFCFLLVIGILYLALRSLPLVVAIVGALLIGLVWTAAFAAGVVGHLNLVSLSFPILFIGLGVDFGIHLGLAYADALRRQEGHSEALRKGVSEVGSSLTICSITTAIGFFVFLPTDYRGVAEMGLIAGSGMFIILFQTLTIVPALLSAWLAPDPSRLTTSLRFERDWWLIFEQHPNAVRAVTLVLALLALMLVPRARFDVNVIAMRSPDAESVQAFDDLLAESGTASPWYVNSVAENLQAAQALSQRMRELDTVALTITLQDFVPTDQEDKIAILQDVAFLMDTPPLPAAPRDPPPVEEQVAALRELHTLLGLESTAGGQGELGRSVSRLHERLGQFLADIEEQGNQAEALAKLDEILLSGLPEQIDRLKESLAAEEITLDDLPDQIVNRMIAKDGRARIQIFPAENLGQEEAFNRFAEQVLSVDPKAAGIAINLHGFERAIRDSFQQALISALLATVVILYLLWRRISLIVLAMAPLLLSALLTVAFMVIADLPFNFANVVVIPLLMGIGVDSGIHLVHRAITIPPGTSLMESTTARAVLYSAITTVVSFGSLALSSHRGIANLGLVLTAGMVITVAANLIVLPALLTLRGERGGERAD